MNIPANLLYTKSHEWVEKLSDTSARIGLTDYAQDQLGDLVFINLPAADDAVTAGETFADAESVKAVSDIFSPVTGIVSAVNEDLLDAPEAINATPYESFLIEVSDITDWEDLLDADAYKAICE
ncbi:MAG: glycine cleavage system protein GcvH [Ruthenibacterium sp.]